MSTDQKPFGHFVYIAAEQRGEFVHDLDEAIDDLTNCECEVTDLYDHPAPAGGAEPVALTEEYATAVRDLAKSQDMSEIAVIRAAIRLYQAERHGTATVAFKREMSMLPPAPTAQPTHSVSFPRPGSAPLVVADDAQLQWDEGEGPAQPERLPHVSALDPVMQEINGVRICPETDVQCGRTPCAKCPKAAQPEVPAAEPSPSLIEAVDALLEQTLCGCPPSMRFDRGEHLSGCHLFDLNLARLATPAPAAPLPAELTDAEILNLSCVHGLSIFNNGSYLSGHLEDADTTDELLTFARALIKAQGGSQ